ncbi:DUF4185 domain-containing protein [Parapedobacter tibetensis]|uniref:DUF4185 domain-containing protein n=1 Tax=Parapedobacter tibetensis TaxID=2972951 RepID=UPI00214D948B|nr:DUF4185 domain-containing protein [Parapedobacter tibetensis]
MNHAALVINYLVKRLSAVFCMLMLITNSYGQQNDMLDFRVVEAPEWTQLFNRDSGWIGGDGLFSIPLNGVDTVESMRHTETLLVFSDSFWGSKANGKIASGGRMTNNVVALIPSGTVDKETIKFYSAHDADSQRTAVFTPSTPSAETGNYYWLGDGFVNREKGNTTYLFAYRMKNTGAKVFGFKECGNVLIAVDENDRPPFARHRQLETPLFAEESANQEAYSFGAGILVNTAWAGAPNPDGYVYVYGVRGGAKDLLVARVLPSEMEDFEQWAYWNGKDWDKNIQHAAKLTSNVSNELSITPLPDGRFALIFQKNGIEPLIGLRVGESPIGPFGPIIPVFECPEPARKKTLFAYNAKAHPHLSKKGELLISYHVNSFDFLKDFSEEPDTFAPKFIRLIWE